MLAGVITVAAERRRRLRAAWIGGAATGMLGLTFGSGARSEESGLVPWIEIEPRSELQPVRADVERSSESAPLSMLAVENDLFSSALDAGRAGDRREAVELLNVLLARFPNSPLKQSAESARAKLSELVQLAR